MLTVAFVPDVKHGYRSTNSAKRRLRERATVPESDTIYDGDAPALQEIVFFAFFSQDFG